MQVNQRVLQSITRSFSLIFQEAMAAAEPLWPKLATEVPSSTREQVYPWLGAFPTLREWIGDRQIHNLALHDWTIVNRSWEVTIEVDRDDIEDDLLGVYTPILQQMGEAAALHPDQLVFELIRRGFDDKCYDGKKFFADNHQIGKSPKQSNLGTKALSAESYGEARARMMTFKDENGEPLNIVPNLLVVPPQLESVALEILSAERNAFGATNIYRGSAELLVAPRLASEPTAWFLLDTRKPIRPFIFQRRKAPEFVSRDQITDENVFMRKKFQYGADCRDNAGYGFWQMAFGSTGEEPAEQE